MADAPWLSIITVVKDDHDGIKSTVQSIEKQHVEGVEWVVVDSSADPAKVAEVAQQSSLDARLIHQPPRGIYPAMNHGLSAASGTYAHFLNAGDTFAASQVLRKLREILEDSHSDWLYGPVRIVETSGRVTQTPSWDYNTERKRLFARGKFPSHQGTLAKRSLLESLGGFDTSYRIAADYAMALRLSQHSSPGIVNFPIAEFLEGGVSTTDWKQSFREFHRARRQVLQPTGMANLLELWNTGLHFSKVFVYRDLGVGLRHSRSNI